MRPLSHEISHLYLHELDPEKLADLIYELGWRKKVEEKSLIHLPDHVLLRPDSANSFTEDIANHFEDFLHAEGELRKKFPKRYELIKGLLPSTFKLEKP